MRRDLWLITTGAAVSSSGTAVSQVVLLVHLADISPFAVTAMLVAGVLPVSLGAPLFGLLVDRLPNRRLMQGAQLVQAVGMTAVAFLLGNVVPLLVAALVIGCGNAVANPAAAALVPKAAGPGVAQGYSWLATARSTGFLVGTALGGVLITAVGNRTALLLDAATYLVQAVLLLLLKVERDPRREPRSEHGGALAGLRHVRTDSVLFIAVAGAATSALCIVMVNIADVFYITDLLHGDTVTVSLVFTAWMVGGLIGARVSGRLTGERVLVLALIGSSTLIGLTLVAPAVVVHVAVLAVAFVIGGFANGVYTVSVQALTRSRTPEPLHGRAFAAVDAAIRTAYTLGTVLGGVLVAGIGPRWTLAVAGGTTVLVGLLTFGFTRARERQRAVSPP